MSRNNSDTTIIQVIAMICAFVVLVAFLLSAINTKWDIIDEEIVIKIVNYIKYFGAIATVSLFLLDYAITHSVIMQIIVCVLIAGTVVMQFLNFEQIQGFIASI